MNEPPSEIYGLDIRDVLVRYPELSDEATRLFSLCRPPLMLGVWTKAEMLRHDPDIDLADDWEQQEAVALVQEFIEDRRHLHVSKQMRKALREAIDENLMRTHKLNR